MSNKMKCAYYLLPLAFCLFLFACGGNGPENSGSGSTGSGTGTIVFDLEWQHSPQASIFSDEIRSLRQDIGRSTSDCCVDYGITTVTAKVYNSSNSQIASGSWACSAHQGTITGVPVGTNHWLRLEGTCSGGAINWRGDRTGITVNNGATTNAGTVPIAYIGGDTTPPTVSPASPLSGATNVPVTTSISATFSEAMAVSTINETTFTLKKGTTSVSGTVTYDSTNKKATLVPSSSLDYSTTYTATISTGVTDMAGNHMTSDAQWSFTTEASPLVPPIPPTGLTATAGDRQVSISWNSVSGATSYNIYWSTASGVTISTGTKIPSISNTSYSHTGLANGTTYYYVVTAVNSYGESGISSPAPATPGAPPVPPTGLLASPGNGQVTVSWNSVSGSTSYNIYWSYASGVTKTNGTKISLTTNSYIHMGLTNGTTYYYVVTAVNNYGESAESSPVSASPGIPPQGPPTGVTATAGDTQVTISWSSATGATSYNIYWNTTGWPTKTTGTKISNVGSPFVHLGLTNGTAYYYVVTAVNSFGESWESSLVSAVPGTAPAAPTDVTASPGDGQISISWSNSAGATSYNIYWSTAPGVTKANGTKISLATSPYIHTGLTNGKPYYYVVTAVNSYGESSTSNEVPQTPAGTAPIIPKNVKTYPGDGQITISWDSVSFATSYNIYWSTTTGVSKSTGTKISNVTSPYTHTGLTNGTTYFYVVTAVNSYGESGESSESSVTPATVLLSEAGTLSSTGDKKYHQVSVSGGQKLFFTMDVPSGQNYFLYVKYGSQPTSTNYDAQSTLWGTGVDQAVSIANSQTGTYYIMVYANSYSSGYSGSYTITASTAFTSLTLGAGVIGSLSKTGDATYYQVNVSSEQKLFVTLDVPSGQSYYLYVKCGSLPTTSDYDAQAAIWDTGVDQAASIYSTQAGTYYIMVYANSYSASYLGSYTITALTEVTSLTLAASFSDSFSKVGDKNYYQVSVPGGEKLYVTVDVPSGQTYWLYVKYGSLPTTVNYDAKSETWNAGAQQAITVDNVQEGIYYIMVYSYSYNANHAGGYKILASTTTSVNVGW
jgi:hypothetical protein